MSNGIATQVSGERDSLCQTELQLRFPANERAYVKRNCYITYIPIGKSHMYLTAIIDWYSRFIVGWELSDSLDTASVLVALKRAIEKYGKPEILNSDQGSQFTSDDYVSFLKTTGIRQSMDGKARWVDNVIIERWFRSLKCDYIYINEHQTPKALRQGINKYIQEYNFERPHQSLAYQRPEQVYTQVVA